MSQNYQTWQRPLVERLETRQLLSVSPQLVVDFDKGAPRDFEQQVDNVWLDDELYFAADDGSGDVELWKSDGTPEGTVRIADIQEGIQGSLPRDFVAIDGRVLFTVYTREFGRELWSTDGTEEGTMMVSDVAPGANSPSLNLRDSAQLGGKLYYGQEQMLWTSDGTSAGTQVVARIDAVHLAATDDAVFFSASSGDRHDRNGVGLYVSDGTEEGTRIIKEDLRPHQIVADNDVVYFHSDNEFLWKSDGKEEGTYSLWRTGNSVMDIVPFNDGLFFNTHFGELFYSDGTAEGTQRLKAFRQMRPLHLTMVGNELFFSADERQVWKTDGTPEGTVRLANVREAQHFRSFGETLYFQGEIRHNEPRLWKSDGTVGGTHVVSLSDSSSDHQDAWVLSGNADSVLLWSADRDVPGLWTANHGIDDTQSLNDSISGASSGGRFGNLIKVDENLFLRNRDLWRIVESEQPVRMEQVSPQDPLFQSVDHALAAQWERDRNGAEIGDLRFSVSDGDLWVYDSARNVRRSVTGQTSIAGGCGYKPEIVVMGDFVYFNAHDEMGNRGLWKSDGTAEGTTLVLASDHGTYPISAGDGVVYFMNTESATGKELWRTDGTQAGTVIVTDLHAGPESSRKYGGGTAAEIDGHLYFGGYDGFHGHELWKIPLETKTIPAPGDANRDGVFNSRDLVQVFQRGEYEDQVLSNSTWDDGDWNNDGDFTSADLVFAFQSGHYEQSLGNAIPADVRSFQFADETDRMKDMLEDGDLAEQFDLIHTL